VSKIHGHLDRFLKWWLTIPVQVTGEMTRAWAPHCDARVLHAPTECPYCDQYPEWQHYRVVAGIAFTGQTPKDNNYDTECPSDHWRGLAGAHDWPGNTPEGYPSP